MNSYLPCILNYMVIRLICRIYIVSIHTLLQNVLDVLKRNSQINVGYFSDIKESSYTKSQFYCVAFLRIATYFCAIKKKKKIYIYIYIYILNFIFNKILADI